MKFIDNDLTLLINNQITHNNYRISVEEKNSNSKIASNLILLNSKLNKLLLSFDNVKIKNIFQQSFEKIILDSLIIKTLIKKLKNPILNCLSGVIYDGRKTIAKVYIQSIISKLSNLEFNSIFNVNNLITKEQDIYTPIKKSIENKNIIFEVEVFCVDRKYNNIYNKHYSLVIRIVNKINKFIEKYSLFDIFNCHCDFGKVKSNENFESIDLFLSFDSYIKITSENILLLNKKSAAEILYEHNNIKFKDFSEFKDFVAKIKVIKIKFLKYMGLKQSQKNIIKLDFGSVEVDKNIILIGINKFYKKDLQQNRDYIAIDLDYITKNNSSLLFNKIIKEYFYANNEFNAIATFEDFCQNRKLVLENVKMMFY